MGWGWSEDGVVGVGGGVWEGGGGGQNMKMGPVFVVCLLFKLC